MLNALSVVSVSFQLVWRNEAMLGTRTRQEANILGGQKPIRRVVCGGAWRRLLLLQALVAIHNIRSGLEIVAIIITEWMHVLSLVASGTKSNRN